MHAETVRAHTDLIALPPYNLLSTCSRHVDTKENQRIMGMTRRIIGGAAGAVVGGVAIFGSTGGFEDKTTRNDSGEIVESGGVGAFVLREGDCIQSPDDDAEVVQSVEGVPCSEPHDGQVYAKFNLPDSSSFPADEVESMSAQGCVDRWEDALGSSYEDQSELDITFLSPTKDSWAADDREVACIVVPTNGSPLVGSKLTD